MKVTNLLAERDRLLAQQTAVNRAAAELRTMLADLALEDAGRRDAEQLLVRFDDELSRLRDLLLHLEAEIAGENPDAG